MEQQLLSRSEATKRTLVSLTNRTCAKSGSNRCVLPLGRALACGDLKLQGDWGPDSEIISGGSPSQDVWFIRSGILRLQRHSYDGRRQILSLFFPGEIVGFEGEFRDGVSVETATQSSLCRIDRRRFDSLVNENDGLRAELFRQKQDQLDRLHWLTWSLGALSPEERLCAFLAVCSKVMPFQPLGDGSGILSVLLSRKDIADLLGTTVESISRIVHRLSEAGLIEIRSPAHFRLLDLPGLVRLGHIDGLFDGMTLGIMKRLSRLEALVAPTSGDSVCFCGRQSGPLTRINDADAQSDMSPSKRNRSAGGFESDREDD